MKSLSRFTIYSILFIIGFILIVPMLWLVATSFKGTEELFAVPPTIVPKDPTFDNYTGVWASIPIGRYLVNTFIITLGTVSLTVVLCSLAAFPLARMKFKGRILITTAILATLVIPQEIIIIPLYLIVLNMGLLDTLIAAMLPFAVPAIGVFIMREAYRSVPVELDEAAVMDGASKFKVWLQVYVPLSRPSMATLALITFIAIWGDFLWPLVVLQSPENFTLQVGLSYLVGTFAANYRFLAAGSVIALLPVVILFLLTQRFLREGFLSGAVK